MTYAFQREDVVQIKHDGQLSYRVRCPSCNVFGLIDDDQFRGRVSIDCQTDGCSFHETFDFSHIVETPASWVPK